MYDNRSLIFCLKYAVANSHSKLLLHRMHIKKTTVNLSFLTILVVSAVFPSKVRSYYAYMYIQISALLLFSFLRWFEHALPLVLLTLALAQPLRTKIRRNDSFSTRLARRLRTALRGFSSLRSSSASTRIEPRNPPAI